MTAPLLKQLGWRENLLRKGDKRPLQKNWQLLDPTLTEIIYHIRHGFNYGLILDRALVVDVDDLDGERFVTDMNINSDMTVLTAKGRHIYLKLTDSITDVRTRIRFLGIKLDVLMGSSRYCVGPQSMVGDHTYALAPGKQLLGPEDLPDPPKALIELLNKEVRANDKHDPVISAPRSMTTGDITNIKNYIAKIPSIQGQNGSRGLMRVCHVLAARLPFTEALALLVEWDRCVPTPPWGEAALTRALVNAVKKKSNQ